MEGEEALVLSQVIALEEKARALGDALASACARLAGKLGQVCPPCFPFRGCLLSSSSPVLCVFFFCVFFGMCFCCGSLCSCACACVCVCVPVAVPGHTLGMYPADFMSPSGVSPGPVCAYPRLCVGRHSCDGGWRGTWRNPDGVAACAELGWMCAGSSCVPWCHQPHE